MEEEGIIKSIADDIVHIDIPIDHPLKNLNLYLFLGEEPTLIDTGPYHPLLEALLRESLKHLGVKDISRILLTHSHIDHFGMAARLRAETGAEVLVHPADRARVELSNETLANEYLSYASLGPVMGFPKEFSDMMPGLAQVWIQLSEPCPVGAELRDGDSLRAGDRTLEVIHTPGHTAGHLCFFEKEEGLLFSGDHLMRSITPNPEMYWPAREGVLSGLPQFIDSLRSLGGLRASCAFPGHGAPIKRVHQRIDMNLLHHSRRMEKTLEAVRQGCSSVWEVALYLFPQIRGASPGVDHFLAIREALGHLVMLEEKGEVMRIQHGEKWLYRV